MPAPKVRIVSDGTARGTEVWVDGKPLGGVRGLVWSLSMDQPAQLHLTMEGAGLAFEGPMDPIEPQGR